MKKFNSFILSLLLLASFSTSAGAVSSNISVNLDGVKQSFEQSPIIVNDFTLVPMREIFEILGAEVKWDDGAHRVTATKGTVTITLDIGKKTAIVNSKPIELDLEAQIVNGRTMVPLRFVSEALGAKVEWDSSSKSINILQGKSSVENSDELVLTYEKAEKMALDHSFELKNKLAEIDRSEEVRDHVSGNVKYTPVGGGNGDSDALARTALKGLVQANLGLEMAKKQVVLQEEILQYKVKTLYNDLLEKENTKKLVDLNVENEKSKKKIAEIKENSGMTSHFDLVLAENTLKESIQKQEVAQNELTQAYEKLNHVLNIPINSRPVLLDTPVFDKFKNTDIDFHVSKVVSDSTAVWLAEQQVQLAELNVDLYVFNSSSTLSPTVADPFKAKEIDVKKAKISVASTKEQLEDATRTIYNSITKLENQYGVLEANLAKAHEGLSVLQVKYDLGMATANELLEAKVSLEQIKKQMFTIVVQLDNLKMAYEKPWVMGM